MTWLKRSTVHCAERLARPDGWPRWRGGCLLAGMLLCAGCSQSPRPGALPSAPAGQAATTADPATAAGQAGHSSGQAAAAAPAWRRARNWDDYRHQAALRLLALNPDASYGGAVPQPALAIPVLEIELNADGSVRRIQVLRRPGQAADTVQLAIAAVQRAAPFGSAAHLPRPWRFTETFLFDDQRRFKPRTLDL